MWTVLLTLAFAQEQECKTAYGQTACGYDCKAAYGQVRCAPVPWGACKAAYGKVVCGPEHPRSAGPMPQASCKSAYGDVACGYDCKAGYGMVRCSSHPDGVCHVANGAVRCSNPIVLQQGPEQACKSAYGNTACGYDCKAAYGMVRCAATPDGRCQAAHGKVTCSATPRW